MLNINDYVRMQLSTVYGVDLYDEALRPAWWQRSAILVEMEINYTLHPAISLSNNLSPHSTLPLPPQCT